MKLTSPFIATQLACFYEKHRFIVAYSGGIDSHVLLHLLASVPELKNKITAIYVHHGLQACADDWAVHCQQCAQALAVDFQAIKVNAKAKQGQSPEEAARNARYQAFKDIVQENDVLLFAQHRNDQLETVLLQLFRGAGLKGLSGMPENIVFSKGQLLRPLLDVSQDEIKQYANQHQLQWVEDPSNQDISFDRNFLRNEIIPLLEQRWPSLDKTVARVAGHCAEAQSELSASAKDKMLKLYDKETQSLSVLGLLEYEKKAQQWVLREWFAYQSLRMPSVKVLTAIFTDILHARPEANPVVQFGGYTVRRYRNNLYCVAEQLPVDFQQTFLWLDAKPNLQLSNNGFLSAEPAAQGINRALWKGGSVEVRYRQGGEKIALNNREGRHSLKKLFQESGILPWLRDRLPIIYIDGQIAAIADLWVAKEFIGRDGEACIKLNWQEITSELKI